MPIFKVSGQLCFCASVPGCVEPSLEDLLQGQLGAPAFLNRGFRSTGQAWTATSPQHVLARDLEALFPPGFLDHAFAVVRNPVDRSVALFHRHRDRAGTIPKDMRLEDWVERLKGFDDGDHERFDNHFRAQVDFLPDTARIFWVEDGAEPLNAWLKEMGGTGVAGLTPPPAEAVAPVTRTAIEALYRRDMDRLGYGAARPVGVFMHVFYEDVLEKLLEHVRRIPQPFRLYISTTATNDLERIAALAPEAEVRVFPNRGRDIWPKLWGFADKYDQHDVVLHLHTKKSVHSGLLRNWLDSILAALLADGPRIDAIIEELRTDRAGIVSPAIHPSQVKHCRWKKNFAEAQKIAQKLDMPLRPDDNAPFDFPAGSMFWARTDVLIPLVKLDLSQDHFPEEGGQTDGTPAHAIERLYGVLATRMNKDIRFLPQPA
ncbi:rhamnan synthesis F family protein [Falsirhodobacter sp. 20TX0035]|uniref:rhamnan synthesis F family protein n=1 Tax=Falsirhodobacter sp. 20TX0035 TaxID=3022019 RepID=UPI00232B0F3E|nr:rhamnan synthesis F family protein [Falsirhodobacter sp. 20TX0035]MDB6455122.1 rhamnan synthesis F family protein [Falsirhodobacter sp. 20TX0035]